MILENGKGTRTPAMCVPVRRCVGVLGAVEYNVFVCVVVERQGWKVS